jgi:hypothetical protein
LARSVSHLDVHSPQRHGVPLVLLGAAIIGTHCYRRENAALQDAGPTPEWIGSVAHHESSRLWKDMSWM